MSAVQSRYAHLQALTTNGQRVYLCDKFLEWKATKGSLIFQSLMVHVKCPQKKDQEQKWLEEGVLLKVSPLLPF